MARSNLYKPKTKFAPILGNNRQYEGRVQAVCSRPRDARGKWVKCAGTAVPSTSTDNTSSAAKAPTSPPCTDQTLMSPPASRPPSQASSRHSRSSRGRSRQRSVSSHKSPLKVQNGTPCASPEGNVANRTRSRSRSATPVGRKDMDTSLMDLTVDSVKK